MIELINAKPFGHTGYRFTGSFTLNLNTRFLEKILETYALRLSVEEKVLRFYFFNNDFNDFDHYDPNEIEFTYDKLLFQSEILPNNILDSIAKHIEDNNYRLDYKIRFDKFLIENPDSIYCIEEDENILCNGDSGEEILQEINSFLNNEFILDGEFSYKYYYFDFSNQEIEENKDLRGKLTKGEDNYQI